MELEKVVANLVQKVERRVYGKHRGLVVENADPEQLGRLRLRVPDLLGMDVVTGWALPCVPYGGAAGQGMLFIPEVGAGVWVEFEAGDLEFPIWVGTFWSKPGGAGELPLPNQPDGAEASAAQDPPTRKIIKTLKGHTIQLEDKDDEELVTIVEATNGHVITLNKDGISIAEGNGNTIVMTKDGTTLTDANDNTLAMTKDGTTLTDANSHTVELGGQGVTVTDGVNSGNQITLGSSGIVIKTSGTQIALGAGGVQIGGAGAVEPLVLGTQLMTNVASFLIALSTHTHTGNLGAPTSPPMAPMNLQVPLSSKHKVE